MLKIVILSLWSPRWPFEPIFWGEGGWALDLNIHTHTRTQTNPHTHTLVVCSTLFYLRLLCPIVFQSSLLYSILT